MSDTILDFVTGETVQFAATLVEREGLLTTDETYTGDAVTVTVTEKYTVPYQNVGTQDAFRGTVTRGDIVLGEFEYRVASSLLVTRRSLGHDVGPHPRYALTNITPLKHYSIGISRSGVWSLFKHVDTLHEVYQIDYENNTYTPVLCEDDETSRHVLRDTAPINTAHITHENTDYTYNMGRFTAAAEITLDEFTPMSNLYETVRSRGLTTNRREYVTDGDALHIEKQ